MGWLLLSLCNQLVEDALAYLEQTEKMGRINSGNNEKQLSKMFSFATYHYSLSYNIITEKHYWRVYKQFSVALSFNPGCCDTILNWRQLKKKSKGKFLKLAPPKEIEKYFHSKQLDLSDCIDVTDASLFKLLSTGNNQVLFLNLQIVLLTWLISRSKTVWHSQIILWRRSVKIVLIWKVWCSVDAIISRTLL